MANNVKLLLIDFIFPEGSSKNNFSTAVFILKQKFKANNINTNIITVGSEIERGNFDKKFLYRDLIKKIKEIQPTHVGMTTISANYINTVVAAEKIKEQLPNTTIFFGGPQASITDIETLNSFDFIDFIFRGEIEAAVDKLSKHIKGNIKPEKVPNLTYRKEGEIIRNKKLKLIDEKNIPKLVYNSNNLVNSNVIRLEGGRGCIFNCTFCSSSNYWEKQIRMKSIDSLIKEIKRNKKRGNFKLVEFTNEFFTFDKKYLKKFCKEMEKINISWSCFSRVDNLDKKSIDLMMKSGCTGISLGVESGDPEIQKKINKNLDLKQVDELIKVFGNCEDIIGIPSFILGLPGDTPKSVYNTIKRIFQYKNLSCDIRIQILNPIRGSYIYKNYKDDLLFDESFYKNSPNYAPGANCNREIELIKKHPSLFSANYKIKLNNFSPFYFLALKKIVDYLLKTIPKTFYFWIEEFDDNNELFFEKIKEIMDWSNKYKITKEELLKSKDGKDIIISFIHYFENSNEIDEEIKERFNEEIKGLLSFL